MPYYRAVLAAERGRPLRPDELVHHVNGDPGDDRIENLEIVTRVEHIRRHRPEHAGQAQKSKRSPAPILIHGYSNGNLPGSLALYGNDGEVRAYALVDVADHDLLSRWCWFLAAAGGYVARTVPGNNRARVYLHRQLLGLSPGDGLMGDHINGDRLDNRRANLRVVSAKGNAQNRRKRADVSSRYLGVSWAANVQKWMVRPGLNGRRYYLGLFDDEDEAGRIASAWRSENMPFSRDALDKTYNHC